LAACRAGYAVLHSVLQVVVVKQTPLPRESEEEGVPP